MRISIISALLLIVFAVCTDLYILSDIRRYCVAKFKQSAIRGYWITSVILWATILVILILPKRSPDDSILGLMWGLFAVLSIYFPKFLYVVCSLIGKLICRIGNLQKNRGITVGAILGVFLFLMMWWGALVTRRQIDVTNVDIVSNRLPESFDGFKIVQFSDAHVGTWGNDTTFISALVDSINAQKPDMIVFTGDVVNRRSSEFDPFKPVFARLKAPHGVYAILGNHDYAGYIDWPHPGDDNKDVARLVSEMSSIGWKVMNNKSEFISNGKDSIALIGVENWGEPPFKKLGDIVKSYPLAGDTVHSLNDKNFKVLLTHNPMHWSQVATKISNIDLTLSGHTHAMQAEVKLGDWKWSPSVFRYDTWGGLYTHKSASGSPMHLYVNIGNGEVGFPARLMSAKPEITNLTLRSE